MIQYIKPALVLAIVTTIISTLLIVTYNLTYVDTSGIITEKMQLCCEEVAGEGDYRIVTDWKSEGFAIDKPDNVEKLILKDDNTVLFQIIANGYAKKGLNLIIAMNADGTVKGVSVVSLSETPGLGTKVKDSEFLDLFTGKGNVTIVKNTPAADNEIQAVTSATYSSKGLASAVNIAVDTFAQLKIEGGKNE